MALVKSFEETIASYWVITSYPTINKRDNTFIVQLAGYENVTTYINNNPPVTNKIISFEIFPDSIDIWFIYTQISLLEEWIDSIVENN